jgi:hypothetical protein
VPGAADILLLVRLLAQLEDLRVVGQTLDKRVEGRLGEIAREAQHVGRGQKLVADIDRAMRQKRLVDLGPLPVAERRSQIDAADLGAERAHQWPHGDRFVIHESIRPLSICPLGLSAVCRPPLGEAPATLWKARPRSDQSGRSHTRPAWPGQRCIAFHRRR